jgi:molybdopterin synthase catalytic subunit
VLQVSIATEAISPAALQAALPQDEIECGAVVTFTGHVRGAGITAMALEHYPGMTERSIEETLRSAAQRWPLLFARVVHRVGELGPGDPIVWLATGSRHRAAAFQACEFIMDYLKVEAPLWKRERDLQGHWAWVESKASDAERAQRWGLGSSAA